MTFDEVIKEIKNNDDFGEYCGSTLDLIGSIVSLKKEYAPEIKMTFEEHEYFKTFRYADSSFTQLSDTLMKQGDLVKFGLKSTPLYLMGLSEEQLMQAWLHPGTIKIISKGKLGGQDNEF